MIHQISPNLTAGAILRAKEKGAIENEQQNIKDTLDTSGGKTEETSEKQLKKAFSEKSPFRKMDEDTKSKMAVGGVIGAAAGGIAGGIIGDQIAFSKIKATNDIQSVTVDWQEPVTQKNLLGHIPDDFYSSYKWWHSTNIVCDDPVYKNNPVYKEGVPLMQDKQDTWTDYGTPVVSWKDNNINHYTLNGYDYRIVPDEVTKEVYVGTDSDGNKIYETVTEIEGYYHRFSADINTTKVGMYQTPKVTFETGVNRTMHAVLGGLIGAGVGAAVGALSVAAVSHIMNKDSENTKS